MNVIVDSSCGKAGDIKGWSPGWCWSTDV